MSATSPSPRQTAPVWIPIFAWTIAVFTITGNAFLIYLIASRKRLRTSANWFVLSLAVADSLVGTSFFPAYFTCGRVLPCECPLPIDIFIWLSITASVANVCTMVMERYVAVVWALKYGTLMTKGRKKCLIVVSWVAPFLVCLSPITFKSHKPGMESWQVWLTLFTVLFNILPSIALFVATSHMFLISRKHSKEISLTVVQLNFNRPDGIPKIKIQTRSMESNHFRVVVAVVAVFVACNASVSYFIMCSPYLANCVKQKPITDSVTQILLLVNSALNPVAYSFFKDDIKKEVKRFFCCS